MEANIGLFKKGGPRAETSNFKISVDECGRYSVGVGERFSTELQYPEREP